MSSAVYLSCKNSCRVAVECQALFECRHEELLEFLCTNFKVCCTSNSKSLLWPSERLLYPHSRCLPFNEPYLNARPFSGRYPLTDSKRMFNQKDPFSAHIKK